MQLEAPVRNQSAGIHALDHGPGVFRLQANEGAADFEHRLGAELDGRIHDGPTLTRGEWRDIGPGTRKVQAGGRGGADERGELPASHGAVDQVASVGSSPRASIRTPWTRRFMPLTPRAW